MNMSSTGSQLSFEDNDMFNLNSDYLGHIFDHDINNIESPLVEKKINIAQLYNEKETFQNNYKKKNKTRIKLSKTNLDKYVNIKNDAPTKNSLEKLMFYYFMMYLFFLWLCFFLFYVSCFF